MILLKDITKKVIDHLVSIRDSDAVDDIVKLLPDESIKPLNPQEYISALDALFSDTQIDTAQYHANLTQYLNNIQSSILTNLQEFTKLFNVINPFYLKELAVADKAVMSLIFKDNGTISNLNQFSKALTRWNRTLHVYHQLVSSKAPEDVELINIQNGSLDVVVNMNVDVAMNFTDIVKYGFLAFNGYLLYKIKSSEIVATYFGNKKLIESEKEREKELLDNIGSTITRKLNEQHKSLRKTDPSISNEAATKKIEEISKVLSDHIVKGNDIKLLAKLDSETTEDGSSKLLNDTNKASLEARTHLKKLDLEDIKLIVDTYTITDDQI
jgi:hypothetical protein